MNCENCIHFRICRQFVVPEPCHYFEDKKSYLKIPQNLIDSGEYPFKASYMPTRCLRNGEPEKFYENYPFEVRAEFHIGTCFLCHDEAEAKEKTEIINSGRINRLLGSKI